MVSSNENDNSSSGCPVAKSSTDNDNNEPHSWSSWFGGTKKDTTSTNNSSSNPSGCPVASVEESAGHSQDPHPDQQGIQLSTQRMTSSIPRGATEEKGPHHQPNANNNTSETPSHWVYPSEQQFFNALRKKGWDHVEASSVPTVLEIHNTINERTWKQVQEWEAGMDLETNNNSNYVETDLKLVRFMGRPKDLSPQAFFWTKILRWADPPFDRHDWFVQKQPKKQTTTSHNTKAPDFPIQRYVIDYYMLPPAHPDMPPTPFVDARPALDSPRAFYQRACRFLQEELPGLTAEYYAWKTRQPRYFDGSLPTNTNSNK